MENDLSFERWTALKQVIFDLYMTQGLKLTGADGLIEIMASEHSFRATKAQYERYFKAWGFRKYLPNSRELWETIAYHLNKREVRGQQTMVYIDGKLVLQRKVRKELSRYARRHSQSPLVCPPLPESVRLVTLERKNEHTSQERRAFYSDEAVVSADKQKHLKVDNLPSFKFESYLIESVENSKMSPIELETFGNVIFKTFSQIRGFQHESHLSFSFHQVSNDLLASRLENTPLSNRRDIDLAFRTQRNQYCEALFRDTKLAFSLVTNNLPGSSEILRSLGEQLNQTVGLVVLRYISSIPSGGTRVLLDKLFCSAILNSHLTVVQYLISCGIDPDSFLVSPSSSAWTPMSSSPSLTPLLFACFENNIKLVQILLFKSARTRTIRHTTIHHYAGHDLRCTLNAFYFVYEGIRMRLPRGYVEDNSVCGTFFRHNSSFLKPEDSELISLLIDSGVEVNVPSTNCWSPLDAAASVGHGDGIHALLKAGADVNWVSNYRTQRSEDDTHDVTSSAIATLLDSVRVWREQPVAHISVDLVVARIFDDLMQAGPTITSRFLSLLVKKSAIVGNLELINRLQSWGGELTYETFLCACASRNLKFIQCMIEQQGQETLLYLSSGDEFTSYLLPHNERGHRIFHKFRLSFHDFEDSDEQGVKFLLDRGFRCKTSFQLRECLRKSVTSVSPSLCQQLLDLHPEFEAKRGQALPTLNKKMVSERYEAIKPLVDAGAPADDSALICLIEQGKVDLFTKLQARVHIECFGKIITAAVRHRDLPFLRSILAMPEIDLPCMKCGCCREHRYALWAAIETGDPTILQTLIDAGIKLGTSEVQESDPFDTAKIRGGVLWSAVEASDLRLVRVLLQAGADPDDPMALSCSIEKSTAEFAREILCAHINRYQRCRRWFGGSALRAAIRLRKIDMIDLLLEYGVNPNDRVCDPNLKNYGEYGSQGVYENALGSVLRMKRQGDIAIMTRLFQAGADPNSAVTMFRENKEHNRDRDMDRLMRAKKCEESGTFQTVLGVYDSESDEDYIYHRYVRSKNALVAAVEFNNYFALEFLLKMGAEINSPTAVRQRETPLQAACKFGFVKIFHLLLQHGADINAPAAHMDGGTALQFASKGGHIWIATHLIQQDADVDAPGSPIRGRTALEFAAEFGRADMVQLLLNAGARIDGLGERQYKRSLAFAAKWDHEGVKMILEAAKLKTTRGMPGQLDEVVFEDLS